MNSFLYRHSITSSLVYGICNQEEENIYHIFFNRTVATSFQSELQINLPTLIKSCLADIRSINHTFDNHLLSWDFFYPLVLWHILLNRNHNIFNNWPDPLKFRTSLTIFSNLNILLVLLIILINILIVRSSGFSFCQQISNLTSMVLIITIISSTSWWCLSKIVMETRLLASINMENM